MRWTVKSCGPDASTPASRLSEDDPRDNGGKKPDRRGEHEANRKTIVQGMPDRFGEPVVTNSCAFLSLHARLRVSRSPGIPCALSIRGTRACKPRAYLARREGGVVFVSSC